MKDDIKQLLFDLLNSSIEKETYFYNGEKEAYLYLWEHMGDNYDVLIDDKFFNNTEDAIEYLKQNPHYNEIALNNKDYKLSDDPGYIKRLYNNIIDNDIVTEKERTGIIKLLSDKYKDEEDYNDEEFLEFILNNSDEEICDKFVDDISFGYDLIDNYFYNLEIVDGSNIDAVYLEDMFKNITPKKEEVSFLNDLCRSIIIDIYNYLISINFDKKGTKLFLYSYLQGNLKLDKSFYKKYFGDFKIDINKILKIQQLLLISDYYNYNYPNRNNPNKISAENQFLLEKIKVSSKEEILYNFNEDFKFGYNCIDDFIKYNHFPKEFSTQNEDVKTMKKINPFYNLDIMTKKRN